MPKVTIPNPGPLAPPNYKLVLPGSVQFENADQQQFINNCGFFAPQAYAESRFPEFRSAVCGQFFSRWSLEFTEELAVETATITSKINSQLKSCIFTRRHIELTMHWQNMLALRVPDFDCLATVIECQAKRVRAEALKKTPALRKQTPDAQEPHVMSDLANSPSRATAIVESDDEPGPSQPRAKRNGLRRADYLPFGIGNCSLGGQSSYDFGSLIDEEEEVELDEGDDGDDLNDQDYVP